MKKINLNSLNSSELLSRDELKEIMGGITGSEPPLGAVCTATIDCPGRYPKTCYGYFDDGCVAVQGQYVSCRTINDEIITLTCND